MPSMETYHGHVRNPQDAIILFEACRIGQLPRVQRRLSEKERQSIRSGSVFVWDEREAGMRRWTDGKSWSASRVSGSFLTYREMEGKRGSSTLAAPSTKTPESGRNSGDDGDAEEGPDGYRYKPDGLMKQSFSITTSTNQHLHLISYYSRSHPNAPGLPQPSTDANLRTVRPAEGLYPESTVNDQHTLPAVTRSPMPPSSHYPHPPHPIAVYPRPSGAAHPHAYTYAPHPHQYPGHSMPSPSNGYDHAQYANGYRGPLSYGQPGPPPPGVSPSYPLAQYGPQALIPAPQAPPNSLDQRPSRLDHTNPPLSPSLPRPQQSRSPGERPQPSPQFQSLPQPQVASTLSPQPSTAAPIDPRLMSTARPGGSPLTQTTGHSPVADTSKVTPAAEDKDQAPASIPTPPENGNLASPAGQATGLVAGAAANKQSVVENGAAASAAPAITIATPATAQPAESGHDRPESLSPGGTSRKVDGPADIPSQKLAFGEDKRALKALDKVFI
jgi:Gti1/Pac2 family transcription factor